MKTPPVARPGAFLFGLPQASWGVVAQTVGASFAGEPSATVQGKLGLQSSPGISKAKQDQRVATLGLYAQYPGRGPTLGWLRQVSGRLS